MSPSDLRARLVKTTPLDQVTSSDQEATPHRECCGFVLVNSTWSSLVGHVGHPPVGGTNSIDQAIEGWDLERSPSLGRGSRPPPWSSRTPSRLPHALSMIGFGPSPGRARNPLPSPLRWRSSPRPSKTTWRRHGRFPRIANIAAAKLPPFIPEPSSDPLVFPSARASPHWTPTPQAQAGRQASHRAWGPRLRGRPAAPSPFLCFRGTARCAGACTLHSSDFAGTTAPRRSVGMVPSDRSFPAARLLGAGSPCARPSKRAAGAEHYPVHTTHD